jgi:hypothetical protein
VQHDYAVPRRTRCARPSVLKHLGHTTTLSMCAVRNPRQGRRSQLCNDPSVSNSCNTHGRSSGRRYDNENRAPSNSSIWMSYGLIHLAEINIDLTRFCELIGEYLYLANQVREICFDFAKSIKALAVTMNIECLLNSQIRVSRSHLPFHYPMPLDRQSRLVI